jgi:TolA-binding protein
MFFIALLLFSALAVSTVAGYFSIVGLMAIFPAAAEPILAMGVVLEVAKLVTASWLYRYWNKTALAMKSYFTVAVIILSVITSMGIFGFLSKAHLEHSVSTGDNTLQVARLDRRIETEQRRIADAETVLAQLDDTVQTLIDYDRIRGDDGAIATRENQAPEREQLNASIDDAIAAIDALSEEKLVLETEQLLIEVEVGPLLYVAEMVYGDTDKETLDKTVRFVIILLILVFDPLAILLVVAANMSMKERKGESITFMSEKDLEPESEDFGIENVSKNEQTVEDVQDEKQIDDMDITEDDLQHVQRLDRRVRKKLEWLIDKKGKTDA